MTAETLAFSTAKNVFAQGLDVKDFLKNFHLAVLAEQGRSEILAGKGISHEQVMSGIRARKN